MKKWQKVVVFVLGEALVIYASLYIASLVIYTLVLRILFLLYKDFNFFFHLVFGMALSMSIIVMPFTLFLYRYLSKQK
jgi:hypothetical protein